MISTITTLPAVAADKPGIETFFNNEEIQKPSLSPDGKTLAMLAPAKQTGYLQLIVLNLDNMSSKVLTGFSNADVASYSWVNNRRIVYSGGFHDVAEGDLRFYPGLFAINIDGTERVQLASPDPAEKSTTDTHIISHTLTGPTWLISTDKSYQTDNVYVGQSVFDNLDDIKAIRLLKVNTKTGRATTYERAGNTMKWLIDPTGTPRISTTLEKGIKTVYYLDPVNSKWRKLAEFPRFDSKGFEPLAIAPDGNLYVTSNAGADTEAVYKYDLTKNALDDAPVVTLKGYDFSGSLIMDDVKNRLVGVHYLTDGQSTAWLDPDINAIQKKIDGIFPSTINQLSFSRQYTDPFIVITSFSDRQPTVYYLYNQRTEKIFNIGEAHPAIKPQEMSGQDFIHYQAKDGLSIPAYLTLPKGSSKKNLPMIVLVHGGPYARGAEWEWDPEVQFLASRGYAVLQPEFRGSTGFGSRHFTAGFKQWGLAMQEDIADGARWAIAQGYADPKRICIAGASYGGYATLMGLAKNPELFKCGFEWIGVTDLNLLFELSWLSDMSEESQKYSMPVLVGDPVKDAKQLKETSPINIADQIKQPLLMAYGGSDRRVPIKHGESFRDAVTKTNKQVEWIQYVDEGHGWHLVKNRVDFWSRVEKFLEKNLAPQ
ncbi:alpha/beta fold hydrolase [Undibacterium sp. Ji67W]|uniref:S9 family peptidase n=1 Tax=Undibacterium sp. Ji67W TaxID=3413042 RepID=UPI003BF07F2D